MKKIYLAIPYTGMEVKSFKLVNEIAAKYMSQGYIVFSPISHSHMIAKQCKLPNSWDFWSKYDKEFIKWCDEVWIVDLGGDTVKNSIGVQEEILYAKKIGKKIKYLDA